MWHSSKYTKIQTQEAHLFRNMLQVLKNMLKLKTTPPYLHVIDYDMQKQTNEMKRTGILLLNNY